MSDRRDWPALALPLLAAVVACQPLNQPVPPPVSDGGTPCSASTAVAADTVVVTNGICNPWCLSAHAGASVMFLNQDGMLYLLDGTGASTFEIALAPQSAVETPPLPSGVVLVTAVENPAATVTILVE
ncbi:MAG TPA: hypothetical protein VMT17_08615 [Anaeromyxobacteraceae bacterium]|nr:hypothetical protein [Anaeromyxobacteraceae bacterium]